MLRLSDHWVCSHDESKSFEIIFIDVWDNILSNTLDPSWEMITPGKSAIHTPLHAAS